MRKIGSWLIVAALIVSGTAVAFAAGSGEAAKKGPIVIGVTMDTVDHPFWQADIAGMEDTAKELGVTLDIQVAQGDANVQNKQIEDMLAKAGWEWMAKYARLKGLKLKVLELVGDLADNYVLDRSKGFKEVMNANKDIVELVTSVPTEWNLDKSLAGTTNALQANKEINAIYMHSDYLLEPTVQALMQAMLS